jgi:hypothetical protein
MWTAQSEDGAAGSVDGGERVQARGGGGGAAHTPASNTDRLPPASTTIQTQQGHRHTRTKKSYRTPSTEEEGHKAVLGTPWAKHLRSPPTAHHLGIVRGNFPPAPPSTPNGKACGRGCPLGVVCVRAISASPRALVRRMVACVCGCSPCLCAVYVRDVHLCGTCCAHVHVWHRPSGFHNKRFRLLVRLARHLHRSCCYSCAVISSPILFWDTRDIRCTYGARLRTRVFVWTACHNGCRDHHYPPRVLYAGDFRCRSSAVSEEGRVFFVKLGRAVLPGCLGGGRQEAGGEGRGNVSVMVPGCATPHSPPPRLLTICLVLRVGFLFLFWLLLTGPLAISPSSRTWMPTRGNCLRTCSEFVCARLPERAVAVGEGASPRGLPPPSLPAPFLGAWSIVQKTH